MKGDVQAYDYVVLSPQWFGHDILGTLFSYEFLQKCRITGCYTPDDIHLLFADVPNIMDLMQILDALNICEQLDEGDDLEYEFPALNLLELPRSVWEKEGGNFIHGGLRLMSPRGMEFMLASVFCR